MVDTSGHRMPPDDEVPDRFYELCNDWAERLRDEKLPFTRLALICKVCMACAASFTTTHTHSHG